MTPTLLTGEGMASIKEKRGLMPGISSLYTVVRGVTSTDAWRSGDQCDMEGKGKGTKLNCTH